MNNLKLKNSIIKILLELFIFNKEKRSILKAKWAKLNIEKYAKLALKKYTCFKSQTEIESKIIWQYWHQHESNAPEIVKKCLESTKKYYPDYKINVLNFKTVKNYINLPEKFYTLLEEKKIPIAIFSDILRLNLLSKYGGIWIDSTMLSTSRLDDEILNSSFFVYQKNPKIDKMQNCMSCYFIKSNANNLWTNLIKEALELYWNENDYLINYFMFEHMVTILADFLKNEWVKIPYHNTDKVTSMQDNMFKKYSEEEFNKILNNSAIHKLTYKSIPKDIDKETNLAKILEL